jgi:hypothetical protein
MWSGLVSNKTRTIDESRFTSAGEDWGMSEEGPDIGGSVKMIELVLHATTRLRNPSGTSLLVEVITAIRAPVIFTDDYKYDSGSFY